MLRQWNTKISASQYGMLEVKIKSDLFGDITFRTLKVVRLQNIFLVISDSLKCHAFKENNISLVKHTVSSVPRLFAMYATQISYDSKSDLSEFYNKSYFFNSVKIS